MDARMVSLHRYRQDEYAQRLASDAKTNKWGRCSCENDPEGCREKRHRWIAFYESAAFRGSCNNSHKVLRSQKVRIIPEISGQNNSGGVLYGSFNPNWPFDL